METLIDYNVKLIQFPNNKVKESVVKNEDDSYTIFIEASLSSEEQKQVFTHAMQHIIGEDFYKDDTEKIEKAAHCLEIASEPCPAV